MERTKYQAYSRYINLQDISRIPEFLSKEEFVELELKILSIFNDNFIKEPIEIKALMEKAFRMGYYAAHIIPGKE